MHDIADHMLILPMAALPGENQSVAHLAGGWNILVCRSLGRFFAVENRCTHRDQRLEGGRIRRGFIFCPHHGARFSLADGAPAGPPAACALRIFPCREAVETLAIDLPHETERQKTL